jgi:DNA-binding transcriptional ArsR family regulator
VLVPTGPVVVLVLVLALRDVEELSVNQLAELVDKAPATVSQHLAKLRMARMVTTRHDGTKVFYRLTDEHASQLVADAIFQAEHTVSDQPHHHRVGVAPGGRGRRGAASPVD